MLTGFTLFEVGQSENCFLWLRSSSSGITFCFHSINIIIFFILFYRTSVLSIGPIYHCWCPELLRWSCRCRCFSMRIRSRGSLVRRHTLKYNEFPRMFVFSWKNWAWKALLSFGLTYGIIQQGNCHGRTSGWWCDLEVVVWRILSKNWRN